jgi:hypothetical protein
MQQQGTGPVKSQGLPITCFAEWTKTVVWREVLQGHDIPNGEAALKALMPREVARALEDIAAVDASPRFREARAAWCAAMESWVRLTPAASEAWQAIQQSFPDDNDTIDNGTVDYRVWNQIREGFGAWGEESPVEFEAWKEACLQNTVTKTWRAAYSEIVNLQKRVLEIKINPAVKVESGWKGDMDLKLLKDFTSILDRKKSHVFSEAENVRELFREAEISLPFFRTKLIHEIYSDY